MGHFITWPWRLHLRKPPKPPPSPPPISEIELVAERIGAEIDQTCHIYFWMVPLLRKLCERIEALERKVGGERR